MTAFALLDGSPPEMPLLSSISPWPRLFLPKALLRPCESMSTSFKDERSEEERAHR